VISEVLKKFLRELLIPSKISWSQNSCGREYNLIQIGVAMKSCFSGENLSVEGQKCIPIDLNNYGSFSNTLSRSSILENTVVKNPLEPSLSFIWPLGFHVVFIHQSISFCVFFMHINSSMKAFSYMC
jgi:hypothetical protein